MRERERERERRLVREDGVKGDSEKEMRRRGERSEKLAINNNTPMYVSANTITTFTKNVQNIETGGPEKQVLFYVALFHFGY